MVIKVNFLIFWVFIFFKVIGVGDKRSENTTMLDVQTLLEALLNMSMRSACFIDKAFFSS